MLKLNIVIFILNKKHVKFTYRLVFQCEICYNEKTKQCLILLHDKNMDDYAAPLRKNGSFLFHVFIEKY